MLTVYKPYLIQWKQQGMQNILAFVSASVMVTFCSSAYELKPRRSLLRIVERYHKKNAERVTLHCLWFLYI